MADNRKQRLIGANLHQIFYRSPRIDWPCRCQPQGVAVIRYGVSANLGQRPGSFDWGCGTSISAMYVAPLGIIKKTGLMISDMGQGGAMAIEDAVSIATLIPPGTTVEDIPERLRLYEIARKSRVEKVLEYTRMNGRDENDVTGPRVSRKHQSPCLNLFSSLD